MSDSRTIQTAAVLGAGAMGAGIAQVAAQAGIRTRLYDIEESLARDGMAKIEAMLEKGVQKGKVTAERKAEVLALLEPVWNLECAVSGVDLVIEAAPEKLSLKQDIFKRVAAIVSPEALIATNTSSLSVTELATVVPNPERFLGLHFFNPPPLMKLLEVVRGEKTSKQVLERALELSERMGKSPIVVKDAPGFASSRLGVTLGLEAIRMVEEGVASAADIDTAMELGYRHPMGPLKLTDMIGLDVRLHISEYLAETLDDVRFKAPALMRQMVAEGHLGRKSGRGFYDWSSGHPEPFND
ncbi:MAG: 3-hydroxyacyl-CoA dehydrogenase family protein [Planctomycetota bacterium]|nr:3-hydroxyacyl-CoA dehydrogenase family protein [Planctomycetota bacterium]MDA1114102.1 3-hydroxyacyl-CoA dehydrogenase family protein [Planctomycetota bacterium]